MTGKFFRFSGISCCCSDFLSIGVIKHLDQKQFRGSKGFIQLMPLDDSPSLSDVGTGTQGIWR